MLHPGASVGAARGKPRRRAAGARWVLTTSLVTAFWFTFFTANASTWNATRRPVGLGVVVLELVFAILFVLRRQALAVSRSPLAWLVAPLGSFSMVGGRQHFALVGCDDMGVVLL